MARTFGSITWAQVIADAIARGTADVSVALPGIVVSYNPATERATVRPAISRLVEAEDEPDLDVTEGLPAIPDVPVQWYRARGVSIKPPVGLLPGDPVMLHCCDRDISAWLRSGALSDPEDARSHHWNNAICVPGIQSVATQFPVPTDAAALASLVLARLNELAAQVNAITTSFNTHTHIESAVAASPTAPPVPLLVNVTPIVPAPVRSAILKVDL